MPEPPLHSVHNAVQLLGLFSRKRRELGLTEIARSLALTKQSTLRLLTTLTEGGLIERVPGQTTYRLGLRLWELGCNAIDRAGQHERLHPIVEHLEAAAGFGALLTAYAAGGETVLVDVVQGSNQIHLNAPLGVRWPACTPATGRPLLAFQPEDEIDRVLSAGIRRYTPRTITDPEALRAELTRVRRDHLAIDRGELNTHLWAVGAPVFNEHGAVAFAVAVVGPPAELQQASLTRIGGLVKAAANDLSRLLGAPPGLTDGVGEIDVATA